jgi:predicted transcriptional regulator
MQISEAESIVMDVLWDAAADGSGPLAAEDAEIENDGKVEKLPTRKRG